MGSLICLLVRAGFEDDCLLEVQDLRPGLSLVDRGEGWLIVKLHQAPEQEALSVHKLIFARQIFNITSILSNLKRGQRFEDLYSGLLSQDSHIHASALSESVLFEWPDTNEGRALSPLSRAWSKFLEQRRVVQPGHLDIKVRAHVLMVDTHKALIGWSHLEQSSSFPGGVWRAKTQIPSPSRSGKKLVEALYQFLGPRFETQLIKKSLTCVDLGASPGGWTSVMASYGCKVTAVDNGPLSAQVASLPRVKHIQADGYKFVPTEKVDWLVCDMLDKPERVAKLMLLWMQNGWCRHVIVNLKLPPGRRLATIKDCVKIMKSYDPTLVCKIKQLYHDRNEVTCYIKC